MDHGIDCLGDEVQPEELNRIAYQFSTEIGPC